MKRLFLVALTSLFVPLWAGSNTTIARDFALQDNQNAQANKTTSEVSERRRHRRHRRHFRRTVVSKTKAVGEKSEDVGETTVKKSKKVGSTVVDKTKTVGEKSKETGEKVVDKTKKVVKPPQ